MLKNKILTVTMRERERETLKSLEQNSECKNGCKEDNEGRDDN